MPRPLPDRVLAGTGGDPEAIRAHILDAAHRVIASEGLAAATTRAVAAEAGLGTGTIYNYFDDRISLLAGAILRRAQTLSEPLREMPGRAGSKTVAANLRLFARHAVSVLDEMVPLFAAAFADAELLRALRSQMMAAHATLNPAAPVEAYLLAERQLGRVAPDADCRAAASILISVCHDHAFQRHLGGVPGPSTPPLREADLIARAITSTEK